jgi:hypothetical protein
MPKHEPSPWPFETWAEANAARDAAAAIRQHGQPQEWMAEPMRPPPDPEPIPPGVAAHLREAYRAAHPAEPVTAEPVE